MGSHGFGQRVGVIFVAFIYHTSGTTTVLIVLHSSLFQLNHRDGLIKAVPEVLLS